MAKFLPDGWKCSARAAQEVQARYKEVSEHVRLIAGKYRSLSYPSPEDFHQEGMLAASYAIDTYDASRGYKQAAYIQRVVGNALAMVAAEVSAMSRAPKIQNEDGSKSSALVSLEPEVATTIRTESPHAQREEVISIFRKKTEGHRRIEKLKANLLPDARLVLELKMDTPLPLQVLSRNLHGRNKLTNHALSRYTGMTVSRIEKSLREIRTAAREAGFAVG